MYYALKDNLKNVIRYQDFQDTPPNLSSEKKLVWIQEEPPIPIPTPLTPEQIIARLWQSAHDYEYKEISGSAIGLVTLGVLQNLPKCLAVQNWIKSIWTEYYNRKALLVENFDFSIVGPCPHTVPELMIELGV